MKLLIMFLTHCVVTNDCEYYSVGLDESIDITDVCQLMIFVRIFDKNFEIKEEFLNLQPLKADTKAQIHLRQSTKLFLNLLHSRDALILLLMEPNRW
jgi:hypothetical protein